MRHFRPILSFNQNSVNSSIFLNEHLSETCHKGKWLHNPLKGYIESLNGRNIFWIFLLEVLELRPIVMPTSRSRTLLFDKSGQVRVMCSNICRWNAFLQYFLYIKNAFTIHEFVTVEIIRFHYDGRWGRFDSLRIWFLTSVELVAVVWKERLNLF